jgi:hypothetical protein
MTDDEITALKAKHAGADLRILHNEDHDMEIVVKVPSGAEWTRFRSMQQDDAQAPIALKTLVLACIVQPGPDDFRRTLDKLPGLTETFGGELVKIAGVSRATSSRKL